MKVYWRTEEQIREIQRQDAEIDLTEKIQRQVPIMEKWLCNEDIANACEIKYGIPAKITLEELNTKCSDDCDGCSPVECVLRAYYRSK